MNLLKIIIKQKIKKVKVGKKKVRVNKTSNKPRKKKKIQK
jgi:hypothetical protein